MQLLPSDDTFALEHGAYGACGIPDGDTIIMTGGFGHNYVTRYDFICMIKEIIWGIICWIKSNLIQIVYSLSASGGLNFVFFLVFKMDGRKKTSLHRKLGLYRPCLWPITCRYQIPRPERNISSLVEELPQLPDIRAGHACSQLPLSGVSNTCVPT